MVMKLLSITPKLYHHYEVPDVSPVGRLYLNIADINAISILLFLFNYIVILILVVYVAKIKLFYI